MVAPTLTLTFDQPGAGIAAGQTDRARTDIKSTGPTGTRAYPITITVGGVPDGASADVALLDEPPSSNPTLTPVSPTTWSLTFDKGAWGPFRVRARALSSGAVLASVTRRISIRSPILGFQYPANAERTDPGATSVATDPSVALTEMNEGGTNNSLAAFHREVITKVESAVSDGGIAEPPLYTKLADASIEHVTDVDKYRVSASMQSHVASSIQPYHGAVFPVDQFTPGSPLGLAPLTDSNIAQAIENARQYAVTQKGGEVLVPLGPHAGKWAIPSGTTIIAGGDGCNLAGQKAGVFFPAAGRLIPLWLAGAPGAGFLIPADCAVGVYFYSGGTNGPGVDGSVFTLSGMYQLNIEAAVGGMVAAGLRINANVRCEFDTIDINGFDGAGGGNYGAGVLAADDWPAGSGNSQMSLLRNINCQFNAVNFDIGEFMGHAEGLNSAFASHRDFIFRNGSDVTVAHGSVQSGTLDAHVEIVGNTYLTFDQVYWECGAGGTCFLAHDITGASVVQIHRHRTGTAFDLFLDVPGTVIATVREAEGLQFATKILRATAGSDPATSAISFINCTAVDASVATDPTKFDCTPYARKQLHVQSRGETYHGGRTVFAVPTQLAPLAQNAEGSSPSAGEINHNTTSDRPRYRSTTRHHDLAYADDAATLSGLLAPYSAEVLDPRVYARRVITSGELASINGLIDPASSAVPPSSLRRPTWHASDEFFGGAPSFECANTGDRMLTLTLNTPAPIGSRVGLFLVLRATGATIPDPSITRYVVVGNGANIDMGGEDAYWGPSWTSHNGLNSGGVQQATVNGYADANAHCIYAGARPVIDGDPHDLAYRISVDGVIGSNDPPTNDLGTTTTALSSIYIGGNGTGTSNSSNVAIAFLAVLKTPLPPSIAERAVAMAIAQYGIAA